MSTHYRTKGFIFKKNEKSESDRTFSVFTEDFGKLEITARAIRKITSKLRSDIDIFYLSEIEFIQGKNTKTLTDAIKIKKFDNLFKDFKRLEIAHQIAEVLENFIKGQEKDCELFDLLDEVFNKLGDGTVKAKNYQPIFYYFLWNFLSGQGYGPEVQKCAGCKSKLNPYSMYFSYKEGGVICKKCLNFDKNAQKINSDIVKMIRVILNKDWDTISRLKVQVPSQHLFKKISENAAREFCPSVL